MVFLAGALDDAGLLGGEGGAGGNVVEAQLDVVFVLVATVVALDVAGNELAGEGEVGDLDLAFGLEGGGVELVAGGLLEVARGPEHRVLVLELVGEDRGDGEAIILQERLGDAGGDDIGIDVQGRSIDHAADSDHVSLGNRRLADDLGGLEDGPQGVLGGLGEVLVVEPGDDLGVVGLVDQFGAVHTAGQRRAEGEEEQEDGELFHVCIPF